MIINTEKISPKSVLDFYREIEKHKTENHGLLVEIGGETVFENYVYPYSKEMPHTLFSVTKSLVSTAVGFAISEGLFTPDTKIAPFFKEYRQSPGTENITVRDLLTMNSGKKFSFLQDMTGDYAEIFMKSGFRKVRNFLYSNNDAHMLSALVERASGEHCVDYLDKRLFQPLGIKKPDWETDCRGVCVGGTGCYLPLEALVKIVRCYADGGKYEGRQVIPEFWAKEATKKQAELSSDTPYSDGYGYLFWINGSDFSMNGLFGQIITYYPQYDAIIGYTGSSADTASLMRAAEEILKKGFDNPSTDGPEELNKYLEEKNEKVISSAERGDVPAGVFRISPVSNAVTSLFFPSGLIPRSISSSMAKRPQKSFDRFSFEKGENEIKISWYEENDKITVLSGLDGKPRFSECSIKGYRYTLWSYGWWQNGVLNVRLKPINTLSSTDLQFRFAEKKVMLKSTGSPDFTDFILGNMGTVPIFEKCEPVRKAASGIMKLLLKTVYMPVKLKK